MAIDKIVGLIGIAVAILSGFVAIPHVFLILVIAGLIVGFDYKLDADFGGKL